MADDDRDDLPAETYDAYEWVEKSAPPPDVDTPELGRLWHGHALRAAFLAGRASGPDAAEAERLARLVAECGCPCHDAGELHAVGRRQKRSAFRLLEQVEAVVKDWRQRVIRDGAGPDAPPAAGP